MFHKLLRYTFLISFFASTSTLFAAAELEQDYKALPRQWSSHRKLSLKNASPDALLAHSLPIPTAKNHNPLSVTPYALITLLEQSDGNDKDICAQITELLDSGVSPFSFSPNNGYNAFHVAMEHALHNPGPDSLEVIGRLFAHEQEELRKVQELQQIKNLPARSAPLSITIPDKNGRDLSDYVEESTPKITPKKAQKRAIPTQEFSFDDLFNDSDSELDAESSSSNTGSDSAGDDNGDKKNEHIESLKQLIKEHDRACRRIIEAAR